MNTQHDTRTAAEIAYDNDLMRLRGHAGQRPGRRVGAETPLGTKLAIWAGIGSLIAAGTFLVARPGGSIDQDDPLNGGATPQEQIVQVGDTPEVPTPTTIIKVQPGDTVSEIAHALQQDGLEGDKDLDQIQEEIYQANPEEYRGELPAGADLISPITPEAAARLEAQKQAAHQTQSGL